MSHIYIQEPPSNGKVLLTTTLGEIDIELWSKEAPKACRNFVQLCMEGYYDDTIFHRVEKDFVAQGGDPTGTGTGGESIYGKPFKDEFHQRLKFNRRGLVAMANAGKDDNGSQFFFTLGAAEELNKKHTIFGKVTGNTLYNMIRFNDIEVDEENRPNDPPKITKTQVLSNPFDDIEPRRLKSAAKEADDKEKKKVKSKSKATKNFKLLSFGEEAEDDETETDQVTKELQIKSSHDLLNDPKLSSVPVIDGDGRMTEESKLPVQKKKKKESECSEKKESKEKQTKKGEVSDEEGDSDDDDEDEMRKKSKKTKVSKEHGKDGKNEKDEKDEKKSTDKKGKDDDNSFMADLLSDRKEFRKQQKNDSLLKKGDKRQDETLALLAGFQSKVSSIASSESSANDSESWMSHKLQFVDESEDAKDANMKGDDWYDIYDPRNPMNERKRKKSSKDGKQSVK